MFNDLGSAPQNKGGDKASGVVGGNGQALALLLLFLGLLGSHFWQGGQLARQEQALRQQEAHIAQLRNQFRSLAEASLAGRPAVAPPEDQARSGASPAKGNILTPGAQQAVPGVFGCTVKVDNPRPGHHYYLMLRQGQRCWPSLEVRMPPGGATTAWQVRREQAVEPGPFLLELREVDQAQHRRIALWQEGSDAHPYLAPAGLVLDTVSLRQ